jgi:hypothetical protein
LKVLDLTGSDMFSLPELHYDRNTIQDVVGGGNYVPYLRKAGNISDGDQQALKDLLEAGILDTVYYYPNTMGLDNLLAPYAESGVVKMIETPKSVLLDNQFHLDGIVQDWNWWLDYEYPASDAPDADGMENIYKIIPRRTSASFIFALPKEYQFNLQEYRYLKFSIYTPKESDLVGTYEPFKRLWPRIMNNMWAFGNHSNFGQEYWEIPRFYIPDNELNQWTEVTLDLGEGANRHNRVIVINIGGEPWVDYNPPTDLVYYFANMRLEKE